MPRFGNSVHNAAPEEAKPTALARLWSGAAAGDLATHAAAAAATIAAPAESAVAAVVIPLDS